MPQDSKNLILAIGLSLLVIIGWQYFYSGPKMERERLARIEAQKEIAAQNPASAAEPGAANTPVPQPSPYAPPQGGVVSESRNALLTRDAALAQSPRIKIETPSIFGSIALKGARIDDVSLKAYRETPNKNSPNIILLSPSGADQAYYAELGFIAPPGANLLLPKPDSLWTADSEVLTNDRPVTLSFDNGEGLIFHKVISVDDKYMFTVTQSVENKTGSEVTLYPYSLLSRHGKPPTAGYSVLHEGMVGVIGQSGIEEITYDRIEKEDHAQKTLKGTGGWLGFTDKYWAAVIVPNQTSPFEGRFSESGSFYKSYQTDYLGDAKVIAPGGSAEVTSRIFAGAKEVPTLDKYQKEFGIEKFDLLIDWGWFYFITKPMFWLMDTIYKIVGNFGVAILITTVIVKAIFYPLASKSYQSMARMKGLQPKLNELKVKYPDDKVKQQQEMMELYKREKINPVAGCLPMLIQIPVFFALYKVLFITIEMRQAPFFGWIHDLSQPDPTNVFNLFGLLPVDPTQLPLIGHFLAIGVWPLIMGVSMFIQMKMNPEPADPVQKQMFTYMPVLFTFMLGTFPVGLVIYWTWNNLLSVTQQGIIMRRAGVKIELWDNLVGLFHKKAVT